MPSRNRRPLYSDEDVPAVPSLPSGTSTPGADQIQGSTAARTQSVDVTNFRQPCTLNGLSSAAYAGALGYFLGFVPATIKFKAKQWGMIHGQGVASASQLALMSGMYTAVHCICQRIRMVEDGWNRGIAGCSTGLVLGWNAGPWSALQSCAGIGLLSALIDLGGGAAEAAEASMLCQLEQLHQEHSAEQQQQQHRRQQEGTAGAERHPFDQVRMLLTNSAMPALLKRHHMTSMHPGNHPECSPTEQLWQQQHLVAAAKAAALPLPAIVGAAAQQLLSVPPLAFLSACCNSSNSNSSATATSVQQVESTEVDACQLSTTQQWHAKKKGRRL